MRHAETGPFTVETRSAFGCKNPNRESFEGLRKARRIARTRAESGVRNAAFSRVLDATGKQVFEVRNIAGKAVQVQGVKP